MLSKSGETETTDQREQDLRHSVDRWSSVYLPSEDSQAAYTAEIPTHHPFISKVKGGVPMMYVSCYVERTIDKAVV